MSTITLPNIRVSSDLTIRLKLKDGGVAIDWSTLQNIRVSLYADDQRSMASRCNVSIDEEDSTILVCQYAANKMQYLGVNRVIVQCKYLGEVKTYDKPAFTFVRWTSDQEGEQITIDDPDVDVEISVEDVSSSILQEAVDAAFDAADRANDAAAAAEHMVDIHTGPEGKSAYEVAVEEGYTGTEEEWLASLKGPVGETPDISIGTVTTVEPGTPAAASMSGTPEAPVLNLSIPKGLVGATPNFTVGTVTTGEPGSSVIVTITGTPEAPVLNLTIPQGMQGNTGSSVDYPYELVNNLTTNDATKGLSAAQGVVLAGQVSQLEHKSVEIKGGTTSKYNLVDMSKITTGYGIYQNNGNIASNPDLFITDYIPVDGNDIISNGFVNIYWGGAVYDSSKTKLRGFGTQQYTYQSGDAYIRISFRTNNNEPMANYGTTLSTYEPFNPVGGYLADLDTLTSELNTTTLRKSQVVDNCTDGGSTDVLSAEQGKFIFDNLNYESSTEFATTTIDKLKYDTDTGKIVTAATGNQILYKQFSEKTIVRVQASKDSSDHISVVCMTTALPANDVQTHNADIYENIGDIDTTLTIPAGGYLCVYFYYGENTDATFKEIHYTWKTDVLAPKVEDLEEDAAKTKTILFHDMTISPSIASNLLYNGTSFESGNNNRKAAYGLCSEKTTIIVSGNLTDASKVVYLGVMDSAPAIGGTMSTQVSVDTVGTFNIRIIVPSGKYYCFAYHETYTTGISYKKLSPYDIARMDKRFYAIYDDRILDTEYSALDAWPNTIEFFNSAYEAGFRSQKADMRLTSDGKIVLCHDAGYTLDGNGRITTFDVDNCTLIHDLSLADVKALEFATPFDGNYIHPASLDEFLAFCKHKQIVPYLTFRAEYISDTVDALFDSLMTYNLVERAIINIFGGTAGITSALYLKRDEWLVCDTKYTNETISEAMIDTTASFGCSILCVYATNTVTKALSKYATERNVRIWLYANSAEDAITAINAGVVGFQNYTITPF